MAGSDYGNPRLMVKTSPKEAYIYRVNDGEEIAINRQAEESISLPSGIAKITLAESKVAYTQDFFLSFPNGKVP